MKLFVNGYEGVIAKAAVHIHSNWSHDGKWTLSRIADFFSKIGYRIVLTSEHDATFDNDRWQAYRDACRAASTDKFLLVPGMEYSDASNTVHVLVWESKLFWESSSPPDLYCKRQMTWAAFVCWPILLAIVLGKKLMPHGSLYYTVWNYGTERLTV